MPVSHSHQLLWVSFSPSTTLVTSAVVADIGDVPAALVVNGRLICAAAVQIAIADKPHIFGFRRIAELGRLRGSGERQDHPAGESSCDHTSRVMDQGTSLHRGSSLWSI